VTFHGPGQLALYPIVDLSRFRRNLHWYAAALQQILLATASSLGLRNACIDCRSELGLWIPPNRKLAFIGFYNQRWITSHGLSLNVKESSNKGFKHIVPCGLTDISVTTVEHELGYERRYIMEEAASTMINAVERVLECKLVAIGKEDSKSFGLDFSDKCIILPQGE